MLTYKYFFFLTFWPFLNCLNFLTCLPVINSLKKKKKNKPANSVQTRSREGIFQNVSYSTTSIALSSVFSNISPLFLAYWANTSFSKSVKGLMQFKKEKKNYQTNPVSLFD